MEVKQNPDLMPALHYLQAQNDIYKQALKQLSDMSNYSCHNCSSCAPCGFGVTISEQIAENALYDAENMRDENA